MNNKFLKIIFAVFIVLVIIAFLPWLDEKMNEKKVENRENLSVNLASFSKESVEKIMIKKGNDEKIISYKDDKWRIGEDEADEKKIEDLFQDFSKLQIKKAVSENENNHAKFEVTKDTGYQLKIRQNGKDSLFFVGKADVSPGDFYLRKDGITNAYLVNGNLRDKLSWEAAKWKKEDVNATGNNQK